MEVTQLEIIYSGVGLLTVILLYIAYTAWRIKRIIIRQIEYERSY